MQMSSGRNDMSEEIKTDTKKSSPGRIPETVGRVGRALA